MWGGHSCPASTSDSISLGYAHYRTRESVAGDSARARRSRKSPPCPPRGRRDKDGAPVLQVLLEAAQHFASVHRPFRRFFVLEVGEHVASGGQVLAHAADHRLAFVGCVVRFAVAVVSEVGGDDIRRVALFALSNTEGDAVLAQDAVSLFAEPGGVAELERAPHASGQGLKEAAQ